MAIALSVKEGIASTYSGSDLTATTQGTCITYEAIRGVHRSAYGSSISIGTVLDKEFQPARIGLTSSGAEDLNDPTIQAGLFLGRTPAPALRGRKRIRFPLVSRAFRTTCARSHGLWHTGDLLLHVCLTSVLGGNHILCEVRSLLPKSSQKKNNVEKSCLRPQKLLRICRRSVNMGACTRIRALARKANPSRGGGTKPKGLLAGWEAAGLPNNSGGLTESSALRGEGEGAGATSNHSFARDRRRDCPFGSRPRGRGLARDDRFCTFRLCVEGAHEHSWAATRRGVLLERTADIVRKVLATV